MASIDYICGTREQALELSILMQRCGIEGSFGRLPSKGCYKIVCLSEEEDMLLYGAASGIPWLSNRLEGMYPNLLAEKKLLAGDFSQMRKLLMYLGMHYKIRNGLNILGKCLFDECYGSLTIFETGEVVFNMRDILDYLEDILP